MELFSGVDQLNSCNADVFDLAFFINVTVVLARISILDCPVVRVNPLQMDPFKNENTFIPFPIVIGLKHSKIKA